MFIRAYRKKVRILGGFWGGCGIGANSFLTVMQVTDISKLSKSAESTFLSVEGVVSCWRRGLGRGVRRDAMCKGGRSGTCLQSQPWLRGKKSARLVKSYYRGAQSLVKVFDKCLC